MYHNQSEVVSLPLHDWEEITFESTEDNTNLWFRNIAFSHRNLSLSCFFFHCFSGKLSNILIKEKMCTCQKFLSYIPDHDAYLTEPHKKQQVLLIWTCKSNTIFFLFLMADNLPPFYQLWDEAFKDLGIDIEEEMNFPVLYMSLKYCRKKTVLIFIWLQLPSILSRQMKLLWSDVLLVLL